VACEDHAFELGETAGHVRVLPALVTLIMLRSDNAGAGTALTRWLADVRRLPCVATLPLGRRDRPHR
jgi:hypothetical protein